MKSEGTPEREGFGLQPRGSSQQRRGAEACTYPEAKPSRGRVGVQTGRAEREVANVGFQIGIQAVGRTEGQPRSSWACSIRTLDSGRKS